MKSLRRLRQPSMHKAARLLGLLFITVASSVRAGEFKVDGIAIDVPAGFEGPATAQPDAHARTYVFAIRSTSPLLPSTVLQVAVYDPAAEVEAGSALADISQRYLMQMLEGVERRRTEYRKTASKEIRLAGFPGSVVSWEGKAQGIGTSGKMYCIATKSAVLFFHVMGGAPNADMAAAIRAVENAHKY